MDFALTSDQSMLQDAVRRALARTASLEHVRAVAEQRAAMDIDGWRALRELGAPGILIEAEYGGLGLSLLDAALVVEELGRCAAPVPFLGTAVLAPLALREAGSDSQRVEWLPRLASGECIAGVAIAESIAGARDGAGVTCESGRLNGRTLFAVDAAAANLFIVGDRRGALYLVRADADGVSRTNLVHVDATRPLSELRFENTAAERLPRRQPETLTRLRDAAWIMLAADTLGAGWTMIDKAVRYAAERKQFGRAIATFQAVKHLCAEMAAELEPGRALVWYAAHAFDHIPEDASLTAAHAKAHLSEVGRFVARTSTEVHGGIGVTDLLGLHYWFKRIGCNRQLFGGPEHVRRLAAVLQGFAREPDPLGAAFTG